MTDGAYSSQLKYMRLDSEALRGYPDSIRFAAQLIIAYIDGLTDGQRLSSADTTLTDSTPRTTAARLSPRTRDVSVPSAAADADQNLRKSLEENAEAAYIEETRRDVELPTQNVSAVCGPIYQVAAPSLHRSSSPSPSPAHTEGNLRHDVVVIWGYGAAETIRQLLE